MLFLVFYSNSQLSIHSKKAFALNFETMISSSVSTVNLTDRRRVK